MALGSFWKKDRVFNNSKDEASEDIKMNAIKKLTMEYRWRTLLRYFDILIKPKSNIIDIGAGNLYISKKIKDRYNCKIIGIDTIDYGTDFINKLIIDGEKLPYANKSFDYALFIHTLHHIEKDRQLHVIQ